MARLSRELDVRFCRSEDERACIDEIPADYPTTNPIQLVCDFLCLIAEQDLGRRSGWSSAGRDLDDR